MELIRRPAPICKASSSNRTSSYDNYTISPTNTTASNTSYTRTYINNFYQNAAYASTLVRAFDSYTSTDGGNTWTAPTSGGPVLPPASYTTTPGGDVPLFTNGSTTTYAQEAEDVTGATTRNRWWELDGYSGCTNGTFNNADLGTTTYPGYSSGTSVVNGTGQAVAGAFTGYTKGPSYYGKTFFLWPPDPRRPLDTTNATGWSSISTDKNTILQFLYDFGYAATDFNNTAYTSTLNGAITNAQTTITIQAADITHFPTTNGFRVIINNAEIMVVTAGAGTATWTVKEVRMVRRPWRQLRQNPLAW